MRCSEYKHEEEGQHSSFLFISLLTVFVCAVLLGSIRLYGFYLENRISETNNRIEACKEENISLSRKYAQLLSPARIYSYARNNLGMQNSDTTKIIRVDSSRYASAEAVPVLHAEKVEGYFSNFNPFLKKAHAEN